MTYKNFHPKVFHFIAIGGVGMSALAKYLLELGCSVSGSDVKDSKYCVQLREMGAKVYIGHAADNIPDNAVIIASSAIKDDNVELRTAKEKGLHVIHRAELLKLISIGFGKTVSPHFIGFAGTHGKTTTSGLCSFVLSQADLPPSYAVGGIIPILNTNSHCERNSKYFIAELDESDGTIVKYTPNTIVINNLEADHPDFYKNGLDDILNTFSEFLANLNCKAKIIINKDSDGCRKLMNKNPNRNFITFGIDNGTYIAKNTIYYDDKTTFDIYKEGKFLSEIELSLIGKHNVYNALAVFIALYENGEDVEKIVPHFKDFSGMGRRFQKVNEFNEIKVYDDYAHHPTEIKATLSGVKSMKNSSNRIVTIFQPHRYTRLKSLWNEFEDAFLDTDKLFVLDVFAAGDKPDTEWNSEKFSKEVHHDAQYVSGTIEESAKKIMPLLQKNDIVITMGAGDITKMGKYLADLHNGTNRS